MSKNARINENIRASEVRVILSDGKQAGIKSLKEALDIAKEYDLDLVEIAPKAQPPVCRIMNYGKYRYEQEQKEKRTRKHQIAIEIKEIKMRPKIDNHDFETKKRHVVRFLKNGAKVKVTVMFRGREITHADIGRKLLERLASEVSDLGFVDSSPKIDGRNMIMILASQYKKEDFDKSEKQRQSQGGTARGRE